MAKAKFENIEANHISEAAKIFNAEGYPTGFGPSTTYDVEIGGELYPPKAVLAYANQLASGEPPMNDFSGGRETDCFDAVNIINECLLPARAGPLKRKVVL